MLGRLLVFYQTWIHIFELNWAFECINPLLSLKKHMHFWFKALSNIKQIMKKKQTEVEIWKKNKMAHRK